MLAMTVIILNLPFINHLLCVLNSPLGHLCLLFYLFCAVAFSGTFRCLHFAHKENRPLRCDDGSPVGESDSSSSLWVEQITALICPMHVRETLTNKAEEGVMLAKHAQRRWSLYGVA